MDNNTIFLIAGFIITFIAGVLPAFTEGRVGHPICFIISIFILIKLLLGE